MNYFYLSKLPLSLHLQNPPIAFCADCISLHPSWVLSHWITSQVTFFQSNRVPTVGMLLSHQTASRSRHEKFLIQILLFTHASCDTEETLQLQIRKHLSDSGIKNMGSLISTILTVFDLPQDCCFMVTNDYYSFRHHICT